MPEHALAGIGVLVTRPTQQAQELVDAIQARGGTAIRFPVIDIVARNAAAIVADSAVLHHPDLVIFISRNAVLHGLSYAAGATVAAVGPATAAALESAGRKVDVRPKSGFDSEHLLMEPELINIAGKTVRIIRGNDGRELLADTLRKRGARVEYLSVYDRRVPSYSDAELAELATRWQNGEINVVTAMSVESVRNLAALLPDSCLQRLCRGALVTPAARVLKEALKVFPGTLATLAAGPQASDMVDAIVQHTATGLPR